jgi:ubiquinone/menaquinone biosynthesis C-methylase UbiE
MKASKNVSKDSSKRASGKTSKEVSQQAAGDGQRKASKASFDKGNARFYEDYAKEQIKQGNLIFSNFRANKLFFEKLGAKRSMRILEVGCYTGYFLEHIYKKGFHALAGCDVTRTALEYGKKQNKDIIYREIVGERLPFNDKQFDLVISFDTVEHIPDVDKHLREVFRVLKKGGMYAFSTPEKYSDILYNITEVGKEYFRAHCSLQTRGSLKRKGKRAGFGSIAFEHVPYEVTDTMRKKVPRPVHFLLPVLKAVANNRLYQPTIYCVMRK